MSKEKLLILFLTLILFTGCSLTTKWKLDDGDQYNIGFRSDGMVVWEKILEED